jgi:hypothetical protein
MDTWWYYVDDPADSRGHWTRLYTAFRILWLMQDCCTKAIAHPCHSPMKDAIPSGPRPIVLHALAHSSRNTTGSNGDLRCTCLPPAEHQSAQSLAHTRSQMSTIQPGCLATAQDGMSINLNDPQPGPADYIYTASDRRRHLCFIHCAVHSDSRRCPSGAFILSLGPLCYDWSKPQPHR